MRAISPTFLTVAVIAAAFPFTSALRAATATPAPGAPAAPSAPSGPSAVSIRVEQANKSDMDGKDRTKRDHERTLNVFVTNNSSEQLDLKVKHVIFGRDMLHHDYMTAGEGEKAVTVKPHSSEKVETPPAKTTSIDQHFDTKTKKKVDASGATIVGAGVQVMQGEKLVAEWYDPMSLKASWGKTIKPSATPVKK